MAPLPEFDKHGLPVAHSKIGTGDDGGQLQNSICDGETVGGAGLQYSVAAVPARV